MINISEELTAKIAQKFFFDNHIYSNVFFDNEYGENELCDILIKFIDFYICIQVKGKDEKAKRTNQNWFMDKVYHLAVKQAEQSINSVKQEGLKFYIKLANNTKYYINLDSQKAAIPLVVFVNSNYDSYKRFYFSETLNKAINIFSYDDFCIMLNTIIIPYDIVGYVLQRGDYMPMQGGKRIVFGDLTEDLTLLFSPQSEKDYAEMYLAKNYYNQDIKPEYISFYNEFLSMIYKDYANPLPELFDMLFSADIILANRIVAYYCSIIERLKSENWETPLFAHNKSDSGILFIRRPYLSTDEEFENYRNNFGTYFAYKYHLKKIYLLIFAGETHDAFTINGGLSKYNLPSFDIELENKVKEIDEFLRK